MTVLSIQIGLAHVTLELFLLAFLLRLEHHIINSEGAFIGHPEGVLWITL